MAAISVSNVAKRYRRYATAGDKLRYLLGWPSSGSEYWALRDVSFSVEPGKALGIVGRNGAGKSTLLKIITGTTRPTSGTVALNGRVGALLQLGIGFNPDMTGRDNARMSLQLMGLPVAKAEALLPEVVKFSELEAYFDDPLRTYSTGMSMRLAFSVVTAERPDILIVDEALSVGDAYFQHKSFARIRGYKAAGTTLLFTSHDAAAVKTICDEAVLLEEGSIIRSGPPSEVLDYYSALIAQREADYHIGEATRLPGKARTGSLSSGHGIRSGNAAAQIENVTLLNGAGEDGQSLTSGEPARLCVTYNVTQNIEQLTVGLLIRDRLGNDIFGTNTYHLGLAIGPLAVGSSGCVEFDINSMLLGRGHYSVTVALHRGRAHVEESFDWIDQALVFEVQPAPQAAESVGVACLSIAAKHRAAS